MQCNTDLIKFIEYTTTFANSAYPKTTRHFSYNHINSSILNVEHTVYCPNGNPRPVSIIPPNSFFAQNISFRMFPSLEFSYVVYMVIHVNLITAKRGIILKINKWKKIHLKLWHLYEKKKTKSETHSLSCKHWLYIWAGSMNFSWFLEYFMSYFKLLQHNYMKKILL